MADKKRASTTGYYLWSLSGSDPASVIKFEGAEAETDKIELKMGSEKANQLMIGNVKYTDIKMDMGIALGGGMFGWINNTLQHNTDYLRQDGAISYADYNRKVIHTKNCFGLLIKKVGFPALDAKGKDPLKVALEIAVEHMEHNKGDGSTLQGKSSPDQKHMANNAFRCTIPGFPETAVTKVDAFAVEQKCLLHYYGHARGGFSEPADISIPDISFTFAPTPDEEETLNKIAFDLHTKGNYTHAKDINIRIAWLQPDKTTEIGALNLQGCMPHKIQRQVSESGKEEAVSYKVTFGVEYCTLDEVKFGS